MSRDRSDNKAKHHAGRAIIIRDVCGGLPDLDAIVNHVALRAHDTNVLLVPLSIEALTRSASFTAYESWVIHHSGSVCVCGNHEDPP